MNLRRRNTITAEQQNRLMNLPDYMRFVEPEQGSLEYRAERAAKEKNMNFNLKQTILSNAALLVRCLSATEVRSLSGASRDYPPVPDCPPHILNVILESRARKAGIDLEQRSRGGSRSTFVPPVETTVSNEGAIARAAERLSRKMDGMLQENDGVNRRLEDDALFF